MRAHQSLPMAAWPLTAFACLVFGGLALLLGMDAGADFRGHQYFSGWTLLRSGGTLDLALAGPSAFLNPLVNAGYVWLTAALPAPLMGFTMGMLHGLMVPVLFSISWRMLDVRNPNRRTLAAAAIAIAGTLGSTELSLLGTAALDDVVGLGILVAVMGVVGNWEALSDDPPPTAAVITLLAGLPAGMALGLKPSMTVYCLGLVLAFPFANMPMVRRLWLAAWFLCGLAAGFLLTGGLWMAHLWKVFGNPFFPFLNHLFQSPWALPAPYLDRPHLPASVADAVTLPFRYALDPNAVSEVPFRDFRVLAITILVPMAAIVTAFRRDRDPGIVTLPGPSGFLMAAAFISLGGWVTTSGDVRHLVPFEMLAPLVLVAAVGALPLPRAGRRGFAAAVVAFVTFTTLPPKSERAPWRENAIAANIPGLDRSAPPLVLLNGREQLSFLLPSFPNGTRFVDIGPEPAFGGSSPFSRLGRDLIATHQGAIAVLHAATERDTANVHLGVLGFELDGQTCRTVESAVARTAFELCDIRRPTPDVPAMEPPNPPEGDEEPPKDDGSAGSAGSPGPR